MSPVDCKEVGSDLAIKWLVEHDATFYCVYCGHEFDEIPKLPDKCPKCRRKLTKFCIPTFEPKTRTKL